MGEVIAVPFFAAVAALWAFFRFQPHHDNAGAVKTFNVMALVLLALVLLVGVYETRSWLLGMGRPQYVNLFCIGGGSAFAAVYLGAAFLARNFYLFKDRSLLR